MFLYEEEKKDSERDFCIDLSVFDGLSGGFVCVWQDRDSAGRLYVCVGGVPFRGSFGSTDFMRCF